MDRKIRLEKTEKRTKTFYENMRKIRIGRLHKVNGKKKGEWGRKIEIEAENNREWERENERER